MPINRDNIIRGLLSFLIAKQFTSCSILLSVNKLNIMTNIYRLALTHHWLTHLSSNNKSCEMFTTVCFILKDCRVMREIILFSYSTRRHDLASDITHRVPKRISDIIDCNLKKDYQISIFGTTIPNTTGHQMTVQVPTSPNVCLCTTWKKQNKRNMRWNEVKRK